MELLYVVDNRGFVVGKQENIDEVRLFLKDYIDVNIVEKHIVKIQDAFISVVKHKMDNVIGTIKHKSTYVFMVQEIMISLECLHDLPGEMTDYFVESMGHGGLYEICKKFNNFNATITSCFHLKNPNNKQEAYFLGEVKGTIIKPSNSTKTVEEYFVPEECEKPLSEMSIGFKQTYSPTYKALKNVIEKIISDSSLFKK